MPESGFAEPSVTWPSMTQACSRAASTVRRAARRHRHVLPGPRVRRVLEPLAGVGAASVPEPHPVGAGGEAADVVVPLGVGLAAGEVLPVSPVVAPAGDGDLDVLERASAGRRHRAGDVSALGEHDAAEVVRRAGAHVHGRAPRRSSDVVVPLAHDSGRCRPGTARPSDAPAARTSRSRRCSSVQHLPYHSHQPSFGSSGSRRQHVER